MEAGLISIMAYNLGTKMLLILIPTLQPLQHYVKFLLISNELNTVLSSNIISIYCILYPETIRKTDNEKAIAITEYKKHSINHSKE